MSADAPNRRTVAKTSTRPAASGTLRRPDALVDAGLVPASELDDVRAVAQRYAVAVTPAMAELIVDPNDPIGRQLLPRIAELQLLPDERLDPIGDETHSPTPGITHRYPDRALLKPVMACAVYCRFCFRREVVGDGVESLSPTELDAALAYIADTPSLSEVILTGGDPLVLSPRRLKHLLDRLAAIDHVEIVRFHTRVPVVSPERITGELARVIRSTRLTPWMVLHTNHAQELTPAARAACDLLVDAGIPMLGQTVLLAGVNDTEAALSALFRELVRLRIKPYYLHHPDLAPGTAHFRLPLERGQQLMERLRGRVSGICQPTYVLDIPGGFGKVPVGPVYAERRSDHWVVTDPNGGVHHYPPAGEPAD